MALSGYQVPHGIYFLNKSLPALIVGRRRIKFSKACHEKLNYCRWVEILYHPIIQTIIIRQTTPDNPNCIEYKVLCRVAASDRGLILVFEIEEAIMFAPKKEEFVDPVTRETKKRQVNIIQMPIKTVLDGHIQNMSSTVS